MSTSIAPMYPSLSTHLPQSFRLVWFGEEIEEDHESFLESIIKLRQVVKTIDTFLDDVNQETTFVIISGTLAQTLVPEVHEKQQVSAIYILSTTSTSFEEWPKVKGTFSKVDSIWQTIYQTIRDRDHNTVSIGSVSKENFDTLHCSFICTQVLKEILLTMHFERTQIKDFLNVYGMELSDEIRREYHAHQPIWWYTYDNLLYSMLNRAFYSMDINIIVKIGFFIRDLHDQIVSLHTEQFKGLKQLHSFKVYRGQHLSDTSFEQLKKMQGELLAFNTFLAASKDRDVAVTFAQQHLATPDLVRVLFVMNVNPAISGTPFVNVEEIGYCCQGKREEILFSLHSVFRIERVKQLDEETQLWQVNLTLVSDDDPQIQKLTEYIETETKGLTGWKRLGTLLTKLGHFDKAEELYDMLLLQKIDSNDRAHALFQLGWIKNDQGNYQGAVESYKQSIDIYQSIRPAAHSDLADTYDNIGTAYDNMREYSKALEYYEKALHIFGEILPITHPQLPNSYYNIGRVYDRMSDPAKAHEYFEKAIEVQKQSLPENHPDLASSYKNIAMVYDNKGDYSSALEYYKQAYQVLESTLPEDHLDLAMYLNSIGDMYRNMGQYPEALEHYEKTLTTNHPRLGISYNNIGVVYNHMGAYLKALEYYEKALKFFQDTFPANHPSLIISYNNIARVCDKIGQYIKAREYFERVLQVHQQTLAENHPTLAISYNNIGLVCDNTGEYSNALAYYGKTLQIFERTLSVNHPDLGISYNNIGTVYYHMTDYVQALSFYEKALEIFQSALPAAHPLVATCYNNIATVYEKMDKYSKAREFLEKTIEIKEKVLPENHPDLANAYNNISMIYYHEQDYAKAHTYLQRALDILQHSLPTDHPATKNALSGIEIVKQKL